MKRHLFLMALLAIFAFLPLGAQQKQKWEDQPYKYEVRIGVSPILDTQQYPFNFFGDWSDSALDMMYKEENGSIYTTGGYSAEFGLVFRDWFTLGFMASGAGVWSEAYDNFTKEYYRKSGAVLTVMPVARFSWLRKRTFRMYSSVGIGATLATYAGRTFGDMSTCFIPVGLQFGGRVYGLAEWGVGMNSNMQAVKVGVGVKF